MSIAVYVPTPYRDLTTGQGHVRADGATIGELIADLDRRYPGFGARLCDGNGVRHHVNVFVNGQEMRCLAGEATQLSDGDEVAFIPALVGGSVMDRLRRSFRSPPNQPQQITRNTMIEMTRAQRDQLIRYAHATNPEECCGFLYGHGTRVERVLWIENIEHSALNFRVRPQVVLNIQNRMDEAKLDWIGIFHSHTRSAAVPSPTDIYYAQGWPNTYHVIVSIADSTAPSVRAWTVDGDVSTEQSINVVDADEGAGSTPAQAAQPSTEQEVTAR